MQLKAFDLVAFWNPPVRNVLTEEIEFDTEGRKGWILEIDWTKETCDILMEDFSVVRKINISNTEVMVPVDGE